MGNCHMEPPPPDMFKLCQLAPPHCVGPSMAMLPLPGSNPLVWLTSGQFVSYWNTFLLCKKCLLNLQVNAHEQTRNEQGLFTYLYHWLVVTDQSTLRDIEDIVGNITHFSAISPETQNNHMVR